MAATIVTAQGLSAGLPGGISIARNVTAAQVIKSAPGILQKVHPVSIGSTSGGLTLVDGAGLAYSATTSYVIGQAVLYSSTLYWCILASLNNLPTNATYWATTPPASQIVTTIPFASMSAGVPITLDAPCAQGIIVSAVPGGGSPQYSISFS